MVETPHFLVALALGLLLGGCDARFDSDAAAELESPCEPVMFEDTPFTHCTANPARHTVGMDLAPEGSDAPYRSLTAFAETNPTRVIMAMNGGMYDTEGQPIGYFVEDGRRLAVLNQNEGPGNFHLLPNGVFFGEADGPWRVLDTETFAAQITDRPQFATQSGPMLVIRGELHPEIDPDGTSHKLRNAVGVDASGRAHFLISEAPVSFGKLARYYRDVLNVDNALFLDGSVSQLWDPANDRLDTGPPIGPLIVVRNRAEGAE
ncbi:MAG: phosphodiester glycosidase family protein [Erythrobacter sp.]|nr:MAG: phosphodiester glycosidase family protein [Erythrobacter sp.]